MSRIEIPNKPLAGKNLIGKDWIAGEQKQTVESPYTGSAIGDVFFCDPQNVDEAVATAHKAFASWRNTPLKERSQLLFKFRELLKSNMTELANTVSLESGKTLGESKAGIEKGIEVIEFALSLQNLDSGAAMDVSRGVSCEFRREPLGVVAGIVPFNFPAMVPMWMFPIAITLGNCFVVKPSEKVPMTLTRMGELMLEAGFPAGVFSIVQGGKDVVEKLIEHPHIKAVGFVGSTPVAQSIFQKTTNLGKRCLALGGAKNHLIVVPDAEEQITVSGVVSSFTGCAGQRCMAASLMVAVGDVDHLIEKIATKAASMNLGQDMGAIIDKAAWERISKAIETAEKDGAKVILDGRKATPPAEYKNGFWLGPTIIDHASPDMSCAITEIFGPVITIVRAKSLAEAMELEKKSPFGNATSVFTTSGAVARYVSEKATSGMVGVNIGVPVPREPFSFGGTKESKFGQGDITGASSLDFWSDLKKITTKWAQQSDANWMS